MMRGKDPRQSSCREAESRSEISLASARLGCLQSAGCETLLVKPRQPDPKDICNMFKVKHVRQKRKLRNGVGLQHGQIDSHGIVPDSI